MADIRAAPLRLLEVARQLGRQKRDRIAALAFASVARAPAVSPRVQAFALYRAAAHLTSAAATAATQQICEEDRARAIQLLQRCSILLKSQPDSFSARMQVFALLELTHTACEDHGAASKTIHLALRDIAANITDEREVTHWWVYFRGRTVQNAVAKGVNMHAALQAASESALQCARHGDNLCATAFYLAKSQIALASFRPDTYDCAEALQEARACLNHVSPKTRLQEADFILFNFCALLLEAVCLIRVGQVGEARTNVSPKLQRASEKLHTLQEDGIVRGSWRWLPRQLSSALTLHVIAVMNHRSAGGAQALPHALAALMHMGIDVSAGVALTTTGAQLGMQSFRFPKVAPRGAVALAVALLESAARMNLVKVELKKASMLISAAVALTFPEASTRSRLAAAENGEELDLVEVLSHCNGSTNLSTQCAVLLVCAEYHCLVGRISAARIAVQYLQSIVAVPERFGVQSGRVTLYDTLQSAASHLSLLTGLERNANLSRDMRGAASSQRMVNEYGELDGVFVNKHVLGTAWFTVGVFFMRNSDVIESRKAFTNALNILSHVSCVNEQVVANSMAVLCGLELTHENITDDASRMIKSAINLARALDDPVTLMRAARQNEKWVKRIRLGAHERKEAAQLHVDTANNLGAKQDIDNIKLSIVIPTDQVIHIE